MFRQIYELTVLGMHPAIPHPRRSQFRPREVESQNPRRRLLRSPRERRLDAPPVRSDTFYGTGDQSAS